MKVYFYHTQDIQMILTRLADNEFPPHFLYGATKLKDYGIDVVWHKSRLGLSRWKTMWRTLWQVVSCRDKIDAIYATHYQGLELIVLLRALRLYRHPIIVWQHQPVVTSTNLLREWFGRLFYRGFDHMIFFSEKLFGDSLLSKKTNVSRMSICHWGMDIPLIPMKTPFCEPSNVVFISSGKELRDIRTLVSAFNQTGFQLELHTSARNGDVDYETILQSMTICDNVKVDIHTSLSPYEISRRVAMADCVCICCLPSNYTVGLTTLVEALALGKPIIATRNPSFPFSLEEEGCGISVDYHDLPGWISAITYMKTHPEEAQEMGLRSSEMARSQYNDHICAKEVANIILAIKDK